MRAKLPAISLLLAVVAVACFTLAAFGVPTGRVNLTDLGLAFGFAAFVVP